MGLWGVLIGGCPTSTKISNWGRWKNIIQFFVSVIDKFDRYFATIIERFSYM